MTSKVSRSPIKHALTSLIAIFFLKVALAAPLVQADDLDQKSFSDLAHYIEFAASRGELSSLARRQFYFQIDSDHAAKAHDYLKMQKAIARKIPNEYSRPIFDIRYIYDDYRPVTNQGSIGILGGIGPVSDANIIRLMMAKLDPDRIDSGAMIHLFSVPPPRKTHDQIIRGLSYMGRITRFLRRGYDHYFLASNTAHLNYRKIDWLAGSDRLRHLPQIIADRIEAYHAAENFEKAILILGTTKARQKRLYGRIFDEKNMAYAEIGMDHQHELQAWIDRVKEGRINDEDRKQLKDFVINLGLVYQAQSLLLACTELPLGLGRLMEELRREGFKVYDTEEMFSDIMVEFIESLHVK